MGGEVPISQASNLFNVVVHNSADSRNAQPSAIILGHVLAEAENTGSRPPQIIFLCMCWSRSVQRPVTWRGRGGGLGLLI